ncbi:putative ABC-type Fe3+-siderophore transporter substrate-binding protein [Streptomyces albus]|uniref:Putative ABC-type Fe3+-siderophore transporter substrate-binding protein n=1 Tax=Streptomyces albus (strain ATCC 21838 / DSM 41398 / FERM P-419 / JCM 4703 / NBRC 107858) TaxID=1081613 RepID=A0A0B5EP31_STRA4|nr:putative ABC-type Fe3+-siderophore transporter substrate-binding protein [Streptomyces albus]AOU74883.1 putative ABC-type Fe3+-siderophore transporter substrate-binding protein [Streptomyces albus]
MTRPRTMPVALGRRRFLGGLTGTAAALGLAACGVSESDDGGKDSKGGKDGGTRSLKTDNGTVTVPAHPSRVVATVNYDALMLLDLGLVPVGVPDGTALKTLMPAESFAELKDVKTIGAPGAPNAQAVAALKPDLILDQFYKDKTAPLAKIAPVAYYEWGTSGALWHEQIAKIAKAVNREDRLTATRRRYEQRCKEVRTTYKKQIAASTWASLSGGQSGKFYLGSPLLTVMRDLGLKIGAGIPAEEAGFVEKSYEELDVLDDCTVLLYAGSFDGPIPPPTQELLDNKLFKGVRAVKAGHAYPVKHYGVATYTFANGAVDEIEAVLEKL